ncbi:uncharacterized protein CIMG_03179 [Coccidioides immitis RS]|uniref:DUF8004 domain-containing protein n=1 Tax=Coccidioides immitis (strain RS) TaxID=246410 RepID=J3KAS7_COCIM|nr:uncharacterized protein CIMG_03179 [Coccidioides immitis RS]EAS32155.3 hypothetical protein CIMG_03179 [Coccidioides immitis RS]
MMLGAPGKSAKRLSSLFSLGSSKEPKQDKHQARTHAASGSLSSQSAKSVDHASASSQRTIRHAASVQNFQDSQTVIPAPRNVSAPLPVADPHRDSLLMPPPSLAVVNSDVAAESSSNENHRRRQSWGGSIPGLGRPRSGTGTRPSNLNTESRPSKGRSWVPGRSGRGSEVVTDSRPMMRAWIAGTHHEMPYDVDKLVAGERIPELWDEQGDTYVYLFPKNTNRPPSFKIHSSIFSASPALTVMARGSDPASRTMSGPECPPKLRLSVPVSPPVSPQLGPLDVSQEGDSDGRRSRDYLLDESTQELHLYLPVPLNSDVSNNRPILHDDDVDMLVLFRNTFAFLVGQSLIATPRCPTIFSIFMEVAGLLDRFAFSNLDGSTFGETAHSSFASYCEELCLFDIRKSPERTIQAIVIAEKMRFQPLYHEGFIHGVGNFDEIKLAETLKFDLISGASQKRLERGYLDLQNRLKVVREKLDDFDFPQLFSGFANSTVMNEAKVIRFKNWKNACLAFRKHVMSYYRTRFGSWPPKANSKKNQFEASGLNRLVLQELYQDFADLYDILVDRTSLTTRSLDMTVTDVEADSADVQQSTARALRLVMSEFDRSTPPVAPPIPFDIPLQPTIRTIKRRLDPKKEPKERAKKLASGEVNEILLGSYNRKSMKPTPFLESFTQFERRAGSGKSTDELSDNRCGQWLFMYAVLQSLPMLVVDAQNIRFCEGVEYFLCVPPRGNPPWCRDDAKTARSWFGVAGGSGLVNLPSDVVANGVEGVYRRSHCWQVATKWADQQQLLTTVMPERAPASPITPVSPYQHPTAGPPALSAPESVSDKQPTPLITPGTVTPPMFSLPLPNPGFSRAGNRSSIHMGLEALPLPAGVVPVDPPSRPVSHNPNLSFDQILGETSRKAKK